MFRLVFRTQCPSSTAATATASKCVTECTGICEHDKPECRWSRLSAGMSARKHARNARNATGTSMVWCAMDSPTNVYAADSASACTEFWLCEYAWSTKVLWFSKLRSEPDELPRKHAEWPGWSDFGRFDASSSADPRGHGHV